MYSHRLIGVIKHSTISQGLKRGKEILLSPVFNGVVRKIAVERRADGGKLDDRIIIRGRLRCYSVEETGVHQFLQKEFHVSEFRIFDAEGLEHAKVTVLHCHEDRA